MGMPGLPPQLDKCNLNNEITHCANRKFFDFCHFNNTIIQLSEVDHSQSLEIEANSVFHSVGEVLYHYYSSVDYS